MELNDLDSVQVYCIEDVVGEETITVIGFPNSIKQDPIDEDEKLEFRELFNKALKRFEVESTDELGEDEKKDFFDFIDKNLKIEEEEEVCGQ